MTGRIVKPRLILNLRESLCLKKYFGRMKHGKGAEEATRKVGQL